MTAQTSPLGGQTAHPPPLFAHSVQSALPDEDRLEERDEPASPPLLPEEGAEVEEESEETEEALLARHTGLQQQYPLAPDPSSTGVPPQSRQISCAEHCEHHGKSGSPEPEISISLHPAGQNAVADSPQEAALEAEEDDGAEEAEWEEEEPGDEPAVPDADDEPPEIDDALPMLPRLDPGSEESDEAELAGADAEAEREAEEADDRREAELAGSEDAEGEETGTEEFSGWDCEEPLLPPPPAELPLSPPPPPPPIPGG